jgi:hypothetical protein
MAGGAKIFPASPKIKNTINAQFKMERQGSLLTMFISQSRSVLEASHIALTPRASR